MGLAYLGRYAERFELAVEHGVRVEDLTRAGAALLVAAGPRRWWARDVVVATGAHAVAAVPGFAGSLDASITALASVEYRRPDQLPSGPVLVVGAGNSGAEIALELAASHDVTLAGRDVGHVPRLRGWNYPLLQRLGRPGAVLSGWALRGGAEPLGRVRPGDLEAAGVTRVPRVADVRDGLPQLADGRAVEVATVVWCTGLRPDHSWVRLPVFDGNGQLRTRRGVTSEPGLYVLGQPNQASITSHLVGGVGADARHVVSHVDGRARAAGSSGRNTGRASSPRTG